ncbi:unnamed protein product [Cochlearia groenlandica]
MNLETCKWERLTSIGHEMLILGHCVTVRAPVKDLGDVIKSGSIYFVEDDVWPYHQEHGRKIVWPKKKLLLH